MNAPSRITPLLLVGGLGTRLRSVVPNLPKVLASVGGKPFLGWILEKLIEAQFSDAILCTGYRSEAVEEEFGRRYHSLKLDYSKEASPLGTGGALRLAAPRVKTEFALVLNGDSFCDTQIASFCEAHLQSGAHASLILSHVSDTSRFGRVDCDSKGAVTALTEKTGQVEPGWINAGIYLLPNSWLLEIPCGRQVSLEREMFPEWLKFGLQGVKDSGLFIDIGTPQSFAKGQAFFGGLSKEN